MIADYFREVETLLHSCPLTVSIEMQIEIIDVNSGYFKAKIRFVEGSELHLFEFVNVEDTKIIVEKYRYHYQNPKGNLIKRWDNAKHHPELKTFPDHLHDRDIVKESRKPEIGDVLLETVSTIEGSL